MLRLIPMAGSSSVDTFKLEGKLMGPWVSEVRDAFAHLKDRSTRTCLDLSDLTFVDQAGAELLRDLVRQGVEIVACSSYVAELLRIEK
jgi:ABC-type transporter Mla MlaB component